MTFLKIKLVAAAFVVLSIAPAAAVTNAEVLDAMNVRVGEISQQMNVLQSRIATAPSAADRAFLLRELQVLNVRRGQLISLTRVVPRYNERFLIRIVTFFDLDVSLA